MNLDIASSASRSFVTVKYCYYVIERKHSAYTQTHTYTHNHAIRHTLDAPALEYVPATQSAHSEAPAVQAQRQTARSGCCNKHFNPNMGGQETLLM